MPLTKKEQQIFEDQFSNITGTDSEFLNGLGDVIFEMTGSVNFRMRLFKIAEKLNSNNKA